MPYQKPASGLLCCRTFLPALSALACILALTACSAEHVHTPAELGELPRLNGHPDLNGLWQAMGTAHWDLEAHSARALPFAEQMGALAAVPAGQSVVVGGEIPYLPEALEKRDALQAGWPASDPEAAC